jgi:hypothetical protein
MDALQLKLLEYLWEKDAIVQIVDIKKPFREYLENDEQRDKIFDAINHLHNDLLIEAYGYYGLKVIDSGKRLAVRDITISAKLTPKGEAAIYALTERRAKQIQADNKKGVISLFKSWWLVVGLIIIVLIFYFLNMRFPT